MDDIPKPERSMVKKMVSLVDKVLLRRREGKDTSSLEREIDALVYALYDLSDAEIALVES